MSLISPKLRSYFKKSILFGQLTCCHPYSWNKSQSRPEPCKSQRLFYIWCLNVVITLFYSLFVLTRCVQVNLDDSRKYGHVRKMYMKCIVFYYAFAVLFQTCLALKRTDLLLYFQQNVALMDDLQATLLRHRKRNVRFMPKVLDLFLDFMWYNCLALPILVTLVSIVNPKSPEFISSVILPDIGALRWILLVPCVLFQMYYGQMYFSNAFVFIYFGFGNIFPGIFVLKELRGWIQTDGSEVISRRKVSTLFEMYTQLEIIRRSYHDVYCTFFLPATKANLMALTIFSTYGVVRTHGLIAAFLAFVGLAAIVLLIVILLSFAKFDTLSSEILFLMKSPKFYNYLDSTRIKQYQSLKPIRMAMSSSYFVDTPCVITVLKIVLDATINLLLTYR